MKEMESNGQTAIPSLNAVRFLPTVAFINHISFIFIISALMMGLYDNLKWQKPF
jgi:hypothetical protein